jgi:Regulator of chromosome condensation (RCC1) repeat
MASTIVADYWRLNNLIVSPNSIVGGGNNSDGTPQKFTVTPVLNVGLATKVNISYTPSSYILGTSYLSFSTSLDLNQGASQSGFYTGFSTTIPTRVSFTANGPNNSSITTNNLYLNPFLFSSNNAYPLWPQSISTTTTTFQYAGIGATYIDVLTLNAYVPAASLQTAIVTTSDVNLIIVRQDGSLVAANNGIVTFNGSQNVGIISFTYPNYTLGTINASFTTSVTYTLLNTPGITTSYLTWSTINDYSMVLEPIFPGRPGNAYYSGNTYYPVPLNFGFTIYNYLYTSSIGSVSFALPLGVSTNYTFSGVLSASLSQDQKLNFRDNLLYVLGKKFYVDYYAKKGWPKAMGFDSYGELSQNFTNYVQPPGNAQGQGVGTYSKIYMGISDVVKTASGSNHNLALSSSGLVYAVGNNTYGQLNLNTAGYSTNLFTRIGLSSYTDLLFNTIFSDIYAQNNSSYIISSNRNLYSFGQNNYNQLGFASNGVGYTSVPTLVSSNVNLVSIFNNRGVIQTYNNGTYIVYEFGASASSTGLNDNGALNGLTQKTDLGAIYYKGNPYTLSGYNLKYIDVGVNHTLAALTWSNPSISGVTSGVIAWGYNNNYQLGTSSSTGYISAPQLLTKFDNSGNVVPLDFTPYIVAGNQWSLGVVSQNGINSTYFYGPGSSIYNGGWISYTGVTTSIGLGQSFFNDTIYKISKSRDHILWLTGLGSVYVSGGAARYYLKNITNTSVTYQSSLIYIDGAPNNIAETQANAYYTQVGNYTLNYYNSTASGVQTSNSGFKKITSSISSTKSSQGIDIVMILFNNNEIHTWAYYYNGGSGTLSQLSINANIPSKNTITDIGVGKSYISFDGSSFIIPSFVSSYCNNGIGFSNTINTFLNIFNLNNIYSTSNLLPSLNTLNEAPITNLAAGLSEARLEKLTVGNTVYDWVSSNYNIVAGYSDGLISVFSDANLGYGSLITLNDQTQRLVAQFTPLSNSPITALKVVYSTTKSSNLLFVALGSSLYVYIPKISTEYNQANWHLAAQTTYSSNFGSILTVLNSNYNSDFELVPVIFSNSYLYLVPLFVGTSTLQSNYYTPIYLSVPFSAFVTNNPSAGKNDNNFVNFISTNQNVQEWYFPFDNFEVGLNYWNRTKTSPFSFNNNSTYPTQILTVDGSRNGTPISGINHVSTSDWFTLLIDTINSNNI